jgi:CRP/FNR family transcriptional regulator, cyclic AMP receptor protein
MSDPVAVLRRVGYLSALDDATLAEIAERARVQRYARGARIVSELESGADVFVIADGQAEVSVDVRRGEKQVLGTIGEGDAFGEMSSLTGELRSASVTAKTDVRALVIRDADFDRLRERRPEVALAIARLLASRLGDAERSIDAIFASSSVRATATAAERGAGVRARRGSVARVWTELVVNRKRDLAFLTLAGFVATLLVARLAVRLAFEYDVAPRDMLRAAYVTGFLLVGVSAGASLLTFRPGWRRAIALAYGVGLALILNELGVTLAFDVFFKDIHTPDPNVPFDIEQLYRRAEPLRAIAIGLAVLFQLAYLRGFYRRAFFVLSTRVRKRFAGRRGPRP